MHDTIPNTYSKELMKTAYEKYQILKADKNYKRCYSSFKGLLSLQANLPKDSPQTKYVYTAIQALKESSIQKWEISSFISPFLRVKEADLYKPSIRLKGNLIEFIYAFGISKEIALFLPESKLNEPSYFKMALWESGSRAISQTTREQDDRFAKLLFYALAVKLNVSFRFLARFTKADKKKILAYCKEVKKSWGESDCDAVITEMATGKRFSKRVVISSLKEDYKRKTNPRLDGIIRRLKKSAFKK